MVSTNDIFATGTGLREAVQGIQSTFRIDVGNLPGKQLEVTIKGMNIISFNTMTIFYNEITMCSTKIVPWINPVSRVFHVKPTTGYCLHACKCGPIFVKNNLILFKQLCKKSDFKMFIHHINNFSSTTWQGIQQFYLDLHERKSNLIVNNSKVAMSSKVETRVPNYFPGLVLCWINDWKQIYSFYLLDPFGKDVKCTTAHSDSVDGDVTEYSVFFTPEVHGEKSFHSGYSQSSFP